MDRNEPTADDDKSPSSLASQINFLGQRFHSCVAMTYVGLGVVAGSGIRGASTDGQTWASVFGLLCFFGGLAWWLLIWRRGARTRPSGA
jgi:hypothetical protein